MAISFEYGLNVPAKEYDGKNKYLRITDINEDSHEFVMENVTSPNVDLSMASQYKLSEGDILFARTGASVGKTYIYKVSDGRVYYAGFLIRARIRGEINAEFVYQNTLTDNYNKYITITSQRSGQPGVNAQEYAKYEILVPDREEQDKISAYLRSIDNLITFHQRKLNILNKICRYAWEQRKVGDYYEFKNGLNKGKEFFGMGTPIVNFTDVFHKRGLLVSDLQGKVTLEQKEIDNFLVKKGDIFFTRTSETVEEIGYPSVMLESPENTVFSGFVLRGRTFLEQDPLEDVFKKYVFFTDSFRKEMMSKSSMTTRALTSGTAIKNMVFYHPLSKEEQKKIGDYFSKLDNLITLHQQKCKQLQIIRKFMLKNMFL